MKNLFNYKALLITVGVLGGMAAFVTSEAAITVIDFKNIAQQLKTYKESVKIAGLSKDQLSLQTKELLGLSTSILDMFSAKTNVDLKKINNASTTAGSIFTGADPHKVMTSCFPDITLNSTTEAVSEVASAVQSKSDHSLSELNIAAAAAIQKLNASLDESLKHLEKLQKLNAKAEGNKQVQQIANEIAIEQAKIEAIHAKTKEIAANQQIAKTQAEVVKRQNEVKLGKWRAEAEERAIEKMHKEVQRRMIF